MRPGIRAIFPAVLAAFFVLLCMQQVSATEHLATPVTEPEPVAPQSVQVQPMAGPDPIVEFSFPQEVHGFPDAEYAIEVSWDFSHIDFEEVYGIKSRGGNIQITLTLSGETIMFDTVPVPFPFDLIPFGNYSYKPAEWFHDELVENCIANDGRILAYISFQVYSTELGEIFYQVSPDLCETACSVLVEPLPPNPATSLCGPNNDILNIPDQPDGVTVNTGSWSNGQRVVSYTPANWAMFPDDFETIYTFEDGGDCPTDPPAVPELITAT